MKKTTSVQIISPGKGLTRSDELSSAASRRDDERCDHLPMKNATNDMSRA